MDNLHIMPAECPRPMPVQDFGSTYRDDQAPGTAPDNDVALWRVIAFSPAMVATGGLLFLIYGWFSEDGIGVVEGLLLTLICFNFFWITFTVSTVALGLWSLSRDRGQPAPGPGPANGLNVARVAAATALPCSSCPTPATTRSPAPSSRASARCRRC